MKNNRSFIILLFFISIALFINVGSYGVTESSDARYAEIAREMYISGDYLHPNLLHVHHYHKPPFTYQITALGYQIFGVNAFGARFFLQIAVILQLILVYALSFLLFNNRQTALWSALIYFSFPLVLISTRNLTTDSFLTTFALLSMFAWVKYRKNGLTGYLYLFTLSLALGFLTKGPVIFIVPLIFILVYNHIEKPKNKLGIHHFFAWLLFFITAFSWYLYLIAYNSDFIDYFLNRQTVERFSKNAFNRSEPFWYFLVFAPLVGLPWVFNLPYLIKQSKKLFSRKSLYFVLLAGIVIPLIFFSISSSKRILYVLPFYSLLAILIAQLLDKLDDGKEKNLNKVIWVYAILIISAFIATLFINCELYFPKMLGIVSIILIPIIWRLYKIKNISLKSKTIYLSFIVSLFILISSSSIMQSNELIINSSKPITDFILENHLNNRSILVYNSLKPSIAFGLNKSIISLYDGNSDLKRETQFEPDLNWKKHLIDMKKEEEIQYLKKVLEKQTVLIVYKHSIQQNQEWLMDYYKNKKTIKKWTVYY